MFTATEKSVAHGKKSLQRSQEMQTVKTLATHISLVGFEYKTPASGRDRYGLPTRRDIWHIPFSKKISITSDFIYGHEAIIEIQGCKGTIAGWLNGGFDIGFLAIWCGGNKRNRNSTIGGIWNGGVKIYTKIPIPEEFLQEFLSGKKPLSVR